jgi:hypothetical protein
VRGWINQMKVREFDGASRAAMVGCTVGTVALMWDSWSEHDVVRPSLHALAGGGSRGQYSSRLQEGGR